MAERWQQNYRLYQKYLEATVNIYKSRRDIRMFTELLLTLTTIIVFSIFAIRPTLVTIAGLNKEIQQKKKTVAILDTKIDSLVTAQTIFEQNKISIELLNFAIPPGPYPQLFIRQLEGVAQKDNVILSSLNIDDVPIKGSTSQDVKRVKKDEEQTYDLTSSHMPVVISASGSYDSILSFIADVEKLRRIILPESTQIFTREETGADIIYTNMNGQLVFRNQQ